jgi:hypothetical protein
MAFQFSTAARNAAANTIEATIGTGPTLEIRTGAPPANCGTADSGTLLATLTLPSDFLTAASNGEVTLNGSWTGTVSTGGNAGHFRIKQGATCHIQGTVSQAAGSGGSGDLQLAQATVALVSGNGLTITALSITMGGA